MWCFGLWLLVWLCLFEVVMVCFLGILGWFWYLRWFRFGV